MDRGSSLDQQAGDAPPAQLSQDAQEIDPPARPVGDDDVRARLLERPPRVWPRAAGSGHEHRSTVPREDAGPQRNPEMAVEDDTSGLSRNRAALREVPGRQLGVVGQHRPDADQDRVRDRPQFMRERARRRPRDPPRIAGARGDPAVEAHRPLRRHEGEPRGPVLDVGLVQTAGGIRGDPKVHLYARLGETLQPPSADLGIRIFHRDDDTMDASPEDRVGARRRPAPVGARLEGDIERRTPRGRPRFLERQDFGVGRPRTNVIAPPDDPVPRDDDGADHRVRAGRPRAQARELERLAHVPLVVTRIRAQ